MLAYLFWHEPRPEIDTDRYVALLQAFHRALAAAPPPSFVRSWSVRLDDPPGGGGPAVEGWAARRPAVGGGAGVRGLVPRRRLGRPRHAQRGGGPRAARGRARR